MSQHPTLGSYQIRINNQLDAQFFFSYIFIQIGINIYEKRIVLQIVYLQELNRDARSTKHKIRLVCKR